VFKMKIEINDRPVSNQNPKGSFSIRLLPETNKEMAQLERCLTVNVQFDDFRRWALPDIVYYGFYGEYGSSVPKSNNDSTDVEQPKNK
jgi:hypothetical protein